MTEKRKLLHAQVPRSRQASRTIEAGDPFLSQSVKAKGGVGGYRMLYSVLFYRKPRRVKLTLGDSSEEMSARRFIEVAKSLHEFACADVIPVVGK